jgi:hypothetical protein
VGSRHRKAASYGKRYPRPPTDWQPGRRRDCHVDDRYERDQASPCILEPTAELGHPRPLADLSTPPGAELGWEAREQWAASFGGIETETWVEVVVRGRSARPVLLRQMTVEIVSRAPAVRGIEVVYTGIGDLLNARYLVVDLDASPPKVVGSHDEREEVLVEGAAERRIRFPYTVSDTSQPEVFYVNVQTKTCDCQWVLKLLWEADVKRGTTTIDDNGKPFRTMGGELSRVRVYQRRAASRPCEGPSVALTEHRTERNHRSPPPVDHP